MCEIISVVNRSTIIGRPAGLDCRHHHMYVRRCRWVGTSRAKVENVAELGPCVFNGAEDIVALSYDSRQIMGVLAAAAALQWDCCKMGDVHIHMFASLAH